MQIKEQIPQIKSALEGGTTPSAQQPSGSTAAQGTMSPDDVKKILDDASIE